MAFATELTSHARLFFFLLIVFGILTLILKSFSASATHATATATTATNYSICRTRLHTL
jgi:hypothetical protein